MFPVWAVLVDFCMMRSDDSDLINSFEFFVFASVDERDSVELIVGHVR